LRVIKKKKKKKKKIGETAVETVVARNDC